MKKSLVALAVFAATSAAVAAPQANTFYAGAKAGWASFHDGVTQFDYAKGGKLGMNRNHLTYGAFAGYQINDFLAAELGYDFFGRNRGNNDGPRGKDKETFNHRVHGTHLSLKASYPIVEGLDAYARAGVAYVKNTYKVVLNDTHGKTKDHRHQASLLLGAGLEYAITPELAARVEYQWLNNAGKAGAETFDNLAKNGVYVKDYRPDIGAVVAGVSYRFGQNAAPVALAPEVVTKNFAFSSDVLFAFGKANLRPEAAATLDSANNEINALGLSDSAIQVNGHADRIGKAASNLKLSQRRAETVANYLVSKGQNPANVTAVGYGSANSVTGNTCDTVKGRKALIACLAPDRRVEVQVQGTKQVTM